MSSASSPGAAAPQSPKTSAAQTPNGGTSTIVTNKTSPSPEQDSSAPSEGEIDESNLSDCDGQEAQQPPKTAQSQDGPPLPSEPTPDGPPLPAEPLPETNDDGWECLWDAGAQAWYFANRITGVTQWENPRVPSASATAAPANPQPPVDERPPAGGYNPAIHGDYDPNAWYAQAYNNEQERRDAALADPAAGYEATAAFNRFTGQFQTADEGPNRHSDEAKSRRQMNAYFDVDAAANAHDGRSLKAERQNQKLSKSELKAYKEKRRAKKEEKRRAWLMD
ncbi:hypothetical protein HIM_07712 [Hirsutella minnesotensis 3608]|uniref:WW domain-containing protein n=1 Tax=Hirsutella minnesotensis 3608 TaxID=1043627 RepID=A0A0F8A447_9HYPO|nr:hypothetical protein HIM_07712 [Hirsutella minnesotensis 3608]